MWPCDGQNGVKGVLVHSGLYYRSILLMFVLCTIKIVMPEWQFWATIFYFGHRAVSRKQCTCSICVLLVGEMAVMKNSPQIASNALNKEYNTRQDNMLIFKTNYPFVCWRPYIRNYKLSKFELPLKCPHAGSRTYVEV